MAYLAEAHGQVSVSCLISGHRLYSRPGVISAHIYGLAADISVLGGLSILGNSQPGGMTEQPYATSCCCPRSSSRARSSRCSGWVARRSRWPTTTTTSTWGTRPTVRAAISGGCDGVRWSASAACVADTPFARMRGCSAETGWSRAKGFCSGPPRPIHTFFMRFPIDVVFLDRALVVLGIADTMEPWRAAGRRGAKTALELPAGESCAARARGRRSADARRLVSL